MPSAAEVMSSHPSESPLAIAGIGAGPNCLPLRHGQTHLVTKSANRKTERVVTVAFGGTGNVVLNCESRLAEQTVTQLCGSR